MKQFNEFIISEQTDSTGQDYWATEITESTPSMYFAFTKTDAIKIMEKQKNSRCVGVGPLVLQSSNYSSSFCRRNMRRRSLWRGSRCSRPGRTRGTHHRWRIPRLWRTILRRLLLLWSPVCINNNINILP